MALLDSGSTTNAVSEEVVISVVNRARSRGLVPEDEAWPIKLERWEDIDGAGGIGLGRHLKIIGAVVMPVKFGGYGHRNVPQPMKFMIFAMGTCRWTGLVIGAPSLELQPLGLGVRTDSGGHSLLSFGINGTSSREA